MTKILFFTDLHSNAHARIFAGVCERARAFGWRVIEIEYARTDRPAEDFIAHWQPLGVIVECSYLGESLNTKAYSAVPAVYIDPAHVPPHAPIWSLTLDSAVVAQLAFDELTRLRPAAYAYVGWSGWEGLHDAVWSKDRGEAFRRLAAEEGKRLHLFPGKWSRTDILDAQRQMADWLKRLPKPCGIFAANDMTAEIVLDAAEFAGLSVPTDISVIGVDNDLLRAENTTPSLTSIEPDSAAAGRLAAELLAERLAGSTDQLRQVSYEPARIVRRGSTQALGNADALIRDMVERIRREACFGLSPADLLKGATASRRLIEQKFRSATGRSLGEEIAEVRFARVFELLVDPHCPIGDIAAESGWKSDSYLKRAFKRRTGQTLRAWRQTHA